MDRATNDRAAPAGATAGRSAARPSSRIYLAALALLAWLAVPWWLILGPTPQGDLVFAVCLLFTVIAFGVAAICVMKALRTRDAAAARETDESSGDQPLDTHTGSLPMRSAALQILLIPASIALGFTLIALVEVIDRT
jgi:type VI protein secretion system component VasK